ncbi:hypothetical protein EWF20_14470 [Sulfolobus sp. S-194]|uniref:hypothetical protein n=1 Tax=Sulfolobus sp. S-194 TaxID=2512240 RepID=UPI001436E782|nr:hypothetical protein [Sulfolobus sp. S-194]QIW25230.1 hypothetical protein EWF20_14470 [Sulfolobus sp. S-194]
MLITPELAVRIILTLIGIITGFYGIMHILFYKLQLPGFEGKWVMNMSATLLTISVVLIVLAYTFI